MRIHNEYKIRVSGRIAVQSEAFMSPRLLAAALVCCSSIFAILTPVVVAQEPGIPKQANGSLSQATRVAVPSRAR